MKKILLMIGILLSMISNLFAQTQMKTKNIPISTTFTGITTAGGNYAKQTKDFFVGWTKGTFGRGYLEFDLSSIPSGATIKEVYLFLTTQVSGDTNYEGKVQLYRGPFINDANATTWQLMSAVGIPVLNLNLAPQGGTYAYQSESLIYLVRELVGKKMYLTVNHRNEAGKIARFATASDKLYLSVTYTENTVPEEYYNSQKINALEGPSVVSMYDTSLITYTFGPKNYPFFVKSLVYWTVDPNCFEIVSGYFTTTLTVRPKQSIFKNSVIKAEYWTDKYNEGVGEKTFKYWADMNVEFKSSFIKNAETIVAINNTTSYSVVLPPGATITWQAGANMTLISGQGTATATFKAASNGYGTVKATVTYDGKSYTDENSTVKVVDPNAPVITTDFSKFFAGNHYSAYLFDTMPGYKYTWSISGATIISSTDNSIYFKVGNFDLDASVLITVTTQSGKRISKSIPVKGLGGGGGVYPEI